jgi:hypothetical protein
VDGAGAKIKLCAVCGWTEGCSLCRSSCLKLSAPLPNIIFSVFTLSDLLLDLFYLDRIVVNNWWASLDQTFVIWFACLGGINQLVHRPLHVYELFLDSHNSRLIILTCTCSTFFLCLRESDVPKSNGLWPCSHAHFKIQVKACACVHSVAISKKFQQFLQMKSFLIISKEV